MDVQAVQVAGRRRDILEKHGLSPRADRRHGRLSTSEWRARGDAVRGRPCRLRVPARRRRRLPPRPCSRRAARKVVDKLIRADLLEEVRAGGSLPVWRRDDGSGPMALRITKNGLEAIDVEDETTAGPKKTSVLRPAPTTEVETRTPKATASRKQ